MLQWFFFYPINVFINIMFNIKLKHEEIYFSFVNIYQSEVKRISKKSDLICNNKKITHLISVVNKLITVVGM